MLTGSNGNLTSGDHSDTKEIPATRQRPKEVLSKKALFSLVAFTLVLFWMFHVLPIMRSGDNWGIWDWDHHLTAYEMERQSILEHGVLPLWNPYIAGGTVLLQHPLSTSLLPDFVSVLCFGTVWGVKILLLLRLLIGLVGGYFLGRELSLSVSASLLASVLINGSGAYSSHVAVGHFEWTVACYLPWTLIALLRALERHSWKWSLAASLGIAALCLGGATYLLFGFAFLVGTFVAVEALRRKEPMALVRCCLVPFAVAALLCSVKLLPSWELFHEHPRKTGWTSHSSEKASLRNWRSLTAAFASSFVERSSFEKHPPRYFIHKSSFPQRREVRSRIISTINNNAYVGVVPLFLVLLFTAFSRDRRIIGWTAGFIIVAVIALSGPVNKVFGVNPWALLARLPAFDSLVQSGRFLIVAVIPLALLAGSGYDNYQRMGSQAWPRATTALAWILLAVVVFDLGHRNFHDFDRAFPFEPPGTTPAEQFVTNRHAVKNWDLLTVKNKVGAVKAHTNLKIKRGAIPVENSGYRGEAFLQNSGGEVSKVTIKGNEIDVIAAVDQADTLVVNQNYVSAWQRIDREAAVLNSNGRISTRVTPQDRLIRFEYRPRTLWLGVGLSLLALGGILFFLLNHVVRSWMRKALMIGQLYRNGRQRPVQ